MPNSIKQLYLPFFALSMLLAVTCNANTMRCEDLTFETILKPITINGPINTFKLESTGDLIMKIGKDSIRLSLKNQLPLITIENSKFKPSDFRVFHTYYEATRMKKTTIRSDRNYNNEEKIDNTGLAYFVIHPDRGLIVVDASGVVFRLAEEVAALNPNQIQNIFTFPQIAGPSPNGQILVTKDGRAFQLYFSYSSWDGWPVVTAQKLLVAEGQGTKLSDYKFMNLSEFDLKMIQYDFQYDPAKTQRFDVGYKVQFTSVIDELYMKFSGKVRGHESSLTRLDDADPIFIFNHDEGFVIWNGLTNTFHEKAFAVDQAIPVQLGVQVIVDLKPMNRIMIITSTGHIRMIDRSKLLDPKTPNFKFVKSTPGGTIKGPFVNIGTVISTRIIDARAGVVEVKVAKDGLSGERSGSLYNGESSQILTYRLEVGQDGETRSFTLSDQQELLYSAPDFYP
jgi:hypothetical protein